MNRFQRWYWLPHLDNRERRTIWRVRRAFALGVVAWAMIVFAVLAWLDKVALP